MIYYGTRLSDNISRREPEGYLICLNVPVARTGVQEYLPQELDMPSGPGTIPVWRPAEEVFAPECIASYEGMPDRGTVLLSCLPPAASTLLPFPTFPILPTKPTNPKGAPT